MIRFFECSNFRNVSCKDLEFDRINILIGPNNAGKSNFIKALSFAANMVNSPQDESTGFLSELRRNGWNAAMDRRTNNSSFKLIWKFELTKDHPVVYTLHANVGKKEKIIISVRSLWTVPKRVPAIQSLTTILIAILIIWKLESFLLRV